MQPRYTRLRGLGPRGALPAAGAAAGAAPALAVEGATTLKLNGPAAEALRSNGVKIAPVKPAKGAGVQITLPIGAGLAGSTTTLLRHRGSISLKAPGNKQARLSNLVLLLGKRSRVTARLRGETIDLFKVLRGGHRKVDPVAGTARLSGLGLKLTATAARELGDELGVERLKPKRFGVLSANAMKLTEGDSAAGGGSAGGPGAQQSNACPLPSGAGPDAEASPAVLAKPPAATAVTSASLTWRVRESFIRYIASGEGTSALDGAIADPPELSPGTSTPLSYGFRFPFAGKSWLDTGANPADPADDKAGLYFSGALRFHFSAHGIDYRVDSPEIELNGANSRVILLTSKDGGAASREVMVNLDLSRAASIRQSGNTYTYERVPGAVPGGTTPSLFGTFYAPGAEFGCFSVAFSTG